MTKAQPQTAAAEKARENRLRRMAENQGLKLIKSRRTDPHALDYGRWMLVDPTGRIAPVGVGDDSRPTMTIDEVEAWLTKQPEPSGFDRYRRSGIYRMAREVRDANRLDPVKRRAMVEKLRAARDAIDELLREFEDAREH